MNLGELKAQYPLRETLLKLIGDRLAEESRSYDKYYCPFHENSVSPSLVAYDMVCACMSGCLINGREYGDVLDFVKTYYNLNTWAEVAATLTGEVPDPPKRREFPARRPARVLSWNDVHSAERNQPIALPYFQRRGLSAPSVRERHLGAYLNWPHTLKIGDEKHTFRARRYAIPDIAFGRVRNIELRLDDRDAETQLDLVDSKLKERVAKKTGEAGLKEAFFGSKYMRVPGGVRKNLIFNAERVLERIEYNGRQGWFSPDMPYVLVHEGYLKALVSEEYGYPSISAKGATGLSGLHGVGELIIVMDNEPDKVRPNGEKFNPGRVYAERAAELSGRRLGNGLRIICPPDGLKAADDAALAGVLHEWLDKEGIEPQR